MRIQILILCVFTVIGCACFAQTTASGGLLQGRVTDESKKPLEFVTVIIEGPGLSSSTNSNGIFSFVNITRGKYLLTLKRSGYGHLLLDVNFNGKDTILNITLFESLIETPVIDVTGSFNAVDISKSTFSVTELNSRSINMSRSQTLAETIQNIPGISNISTGSGIGKPVIRGLSSQSVLIVHDGVKHESQSWGDEHGPELSLFDLDRIEVLRGPASLIYGADGIGGVVNVISKPLVFSERKKPLFYGNAVTGGFSGDNQLFGSIGLGVGIQDFGIKGHFGYRKSGDVMTPKGSFTVNTSYGTREITGGELFNSSSEELQGGANLGFKGNFGNVNLGFEIFDRELGIHEDPREAPGSTPTQKIFTNQLSLESNFKLSDVLQLEPVVSYQLQNRKEFESKEDAGNDNYALYLKLNTIDGSVKLHHRLSITLDGTVGASYTYQKNESLADEKLIPNYNAGTFGMFLLEKFSIGKFNLSAGARFDTKVLNVEETVFEVDSAGYPVKVLNPDRTNFKSLTGSIGAVYSLLKTINIYANAGRGWRPPSEFELYVDGVHEGTRRYEKGLKTISPLSSTQPEESFNVDLGMRLNYDRLSVQLSAYRNSVSNFIYSSPTGDTLVGNQVFDIKQAKSIFLGYEYSVQYQPVSWIVLSASGDFVNTENTATGNPLPFTPPMKNIFELRLQKNQIGMLFNPYIRLSAKIVSAQDETDPLEAKTDGYTLLNGGIGFDLEFAKSVASIDLSVTNIADSRYVDHLSRYKSYALNPGRSFNLQLSVPFRL
jgi:iron complex outermembrane recepter protein